jgi:hypothetical protein
MSYLLFVTVFSLYMVYKVVPTHGTRNPMVYLSVCSLVGSVSVMAIKVCLLPARLYLAGLEMQCERG